MEKKKRPRQIKKEMDKCIKKEKTQNNGIN